ncbi:putative NAD dependent epimerase/dehydratase [Aspergillus saccharolyticus JOP 1030-1]|uniref:Putative NAD dependent epimerase/dehydratase n=1 Tax=Aspergillus saccharolyticus JOP 1030-1 TaxID=1450539 RepID=A0A319AAH6_9EURO|nr:putative NAD dependent epimerase/dehydratase [Aspergillus saccharolyticus JOP 1030-1]PYH43922.1 putative NAD dependent epimerase/dehydratase [Aspergillus saccharolyticus JOP 1030-1]
MEKQIVITGVTGVQGGSVARTYLQLPGWKVRGVTRNPASPKAQELQSRGVEIVPGDLNDPSSLEAAFQEANIIFGVTDFWTIFQDPASMEKKAPNQELTEYCFEVEVQQGKNLVEAAARIPTLERLVFSSMASASKSSQGAFPRIYHMDSKAVVVDYVQTLPALKDRFSQIQAPIYFDLLWQWGLPTTPKKQADGSYKITGVGPANIPVPFGDVRNDFGRCVKAVADGPPGLNFLAVGDLVSWEAYIDIWCKSQGVPNGGYEQHTIETFEQLLPGGLGREFGENVLFAQQFGYDGGDPTVVRPSEFGLKMTSFAEYCERTNFSSIL